MKTIVLFLCALAFHAMPGSPVSNADALTIDMEGDILLAQSDDENDLLTKIEVFNESWQKVAERSCPLSLSCSLNLSHLSAGTYIAKVYSQYDMLQQNIQVN